MKIIKYQKVSSNKYELTLENKEKIKLFEDVILKEELLLKKEINDLEKLKEINHEYEIYDVSLSLVSKKVISIKGLRTYLLKKGYEINKINKVINSLIRSNYLSNSNYAKCYVNEKLKLSLDGPKKIKSHLMNEEIDEDIIDELLNINEDIWYERINKYLEKQLKINKKSVYYFKNKMMVNLTNLGYEKDMISTCLNSINIDNEEELEEKERIKLRKKLERIYSGEELERKIKEKLYQKGFFGG